ncbi:MAG TPA: hypothetical protein VMK12_25040, partial [Anaeromyxobacteraceae bacterium]|nr:hypothetical protein [Anaeromyxobacteraceae bacterium]
GEWVFPVPPLGIPAEHAEVDDDPKQYGSVRLFIERARSGDPRFAPDKKEMATVAEICRRLDGIPLALELAAARVSALGVEELVTHLGDRFRLLTGGRRTALARHRTLRATLDWSFELLPELERLILSRLSVFAASFSLESASAVVASAELAGWQVVEGVANLVDKSLVSASVADTGARYRLLETMRAYALEKLGESGESQTIARRHAEYFRDLFERGEAEEGQLALPERLAGYRRELNDVRAALDWAFSPGGDAILGVAVTAASERLWFGLSLMDESRRRVERALSSLRADLNGDARLEMRLCAALGAALYYTKGPCPEARSVWTDALTTAERLGDPGYRLRAFWGLVSDHAGSGELRVALTVAQRLAGLPADQTGPTGPFVGERLVGSMSYLLGDLGNARRHLENVLSRYPASTVGSSPDTNRVEWDRRSAPRGSLVPVLWMLGLSDQAMHMALSYVEESIATHHPVSLCWALYAACPIAVAVGDLVKAEHLGAMLLEHSAKHAPGFLQALARALRGEILLRRGEVANGVECLRIALDELGATGFVLRRPAILCALAEGLAAAGKAVESLHMIEEALALCERSDERWNVAELLRVKGELLLLQGTEEALAEAESYLLQALDWAHRQGALSWELRCAMSLARMLKQQGQIGEARRLLTAVYDRFTEGFETADLKAAEAMLESLRSLAE